jgi:hypothetical protein
VSRKPLSIALEEVAEGKIIGRRIEPTEAVELEGVVEGALGEGTDEPA